MGPSTLIHRYGHSFIGIQRIRYESFVRHMRELPDGSSRRVAYQSVWILRVLIGLKADGPVVGRFHDLSVGMIRIGTANYCEHFAKRGGGTFS